MFIYLPYTKQHHMTETSISIPETSVLELKEKLRQGPTNFAFRKKDGSLRLAKGTLKLELIPGDLQPKSGNEASPKILPFFDLDKSEWRSISVGQLIFS